MGGVATAKPAAADKPKPAAKPAAKAAAATRPVWPDEGPRTWTVRKTETAITANDLRTRLYQFADDSMEGRRIGERGNVKGTDYIASEFKRLGLKPAGDNGTYFQTLAFGPSAFSATASQLSVAGSAATVKTDWIPMTPAGGIGAKVNISKVPVSKAGTKRRWGRDIMTATLSTHTPTRTHNGTLVRGPCGNTTNRTDNDATIA